MGIFEMLRSCMHMEEFGYLAAQMTLEGVLLWLQVQSKVTLKYDSWHKEVLSKFGSMLGNEMAEFHTQVSKVGAATRLLGFLFACFHNHDLPDCLSSRPVLPWGHVADSPA